MRPTGWISFFHLHFLKIILSMQVKGRVERAWVGAQTELALWIRTVTVDIYFQDYLEAKWSWLCWWTEYGDKGEGKNKGSPKTSSLSKQVLCYDLRGRREPQPQFSSSVHSTHPMPTACHTKEQWIRQQGEGHNGETKEPCISDYIDWILWDWFPKDQVSLLQRTQGIH